MIMKNKHGWIEIVEAFVSILLVVGVVLIVINNGSIGKSDISDKVYTVEHSLIREIETNSTLRTEILTVPSSSLPIEWTQVGFPADVTNKITERTPDYLNCIGKICLINTGCSLTEKVTTDIYSQSVIISASIEGGVGYRQLNIFCWVKG